MERDQTSNSPPPDRIPNIIPLLPTNIAASCALFPRLDSKIGIFAAEAGPHLQARPNALPLAIYRLSAERQGQRSNQSASVGRNLSVPYHGGFAVIAGRSYEFRGTIGKLDNERTTVLQVDHDGDNQQVAETEIVELGANVNHRHSNANVKATYLIGVDSLDVPANTKFAIGSRIFLTGELDSLGSKSGMMIINVTGGIYFQCF
ncbi:hypothetical protein MJO28_011914 [Puccinia striiformis f. sp. tritici]|uniref:Uncharacterized protein n=1 Tax=Puccinia striiformis f. sp. tritici TaxID=168172 RepID=A0ACC0E4S7_9BASI|nr:hypothetical protein MJO28_011914 [Puccinia striiformis f. sp. tritici]